MGQVGSRLEGWLTSIGIALLVCSLLLVPSAIALGDSGSGDRPLVGCQSGDSCDSGCITDRCFDLGCTGAGCTCIKTGPGLMCSGCGCDIGNGKCKCVPQ